MLTSYGYRMRVDSVSRYTYDRELATCADSVMSILASIPQEDREKSFLDKTPKMLVLALNRLRQLCCMPSVNSRTFMDGTQAKLEVVLKALIDKARVEASEALRALAMTRNGMAGLYALQGKFQLAQNMYMKAIALLDQCSNQDGQIKVEVDRFQLLHALVNLNLLIERGCCVEVDDSTGDPSTANHVDFASVALFAALADNTGNENPRLARIAALRLRYTQGAHESVMRAGMNSERQREQESLSQLSSSVMDVVISLRGMYASNDREKNSDLDHHVKCVLSDLKIDGRLAFLDMLENKLQLINDKRLIFMGMMSKLLPEPTSVDTAIAARCPMCRWKENTPTYRCDYCIIEKYMIEIKKMVQFATP